MDDVINPGTEQIDFDSLLAETEAPKEQIPIGEAGTPDTNQPQSEVEAAQAEAERVLKINWRGQEKEVPESTVIRGYQQTYDLDQRFKEFKEQQAQWEQQKQEHDAISAKYSEIDKYATDHPGWAEHVQAQYEASQRGDAVPEGYEANDPLVQQNLKLQEQVQELSEWRQKVEEQQQQSSDRQAELSLAEDITQVRGELPDINFDDVNDQGLSVENQIIQYGIDNGITEFRTAALAYLHPTLVKVAEEKARKAAAEDIQKQRKAGIVSTGPSPHREPAKNLDVKNMTWDQLAEDALREIQGG